MPIDYSVFAIPKPRPREKAGRTRIRRKAKPKAERDRIAAVRAECVKRDGRCSVENAFFGHRGSPLDINDMCGRLDGWTEHCDGPSEWAHMHIRRRSQTRNQPPEVRHDTRYSLMLCRFHHGEYDAHRLRITALTRKGADGPLKFTRAK